VNDLALLQLPTELDCSPATFAENDERAAGHAPSRTVEFWGYADDGTLQLSCATSHMPQPMLTVTKAGHSGPVDLQFSGGLPAGFSGGLAVIVEGTRRQGIGIIRLGGIESPSSRIIPTRIVQAFCSLHGVDIATGRAAASSPDAHGVSRPSATRNALTQEIADYASSSFWTGVFSEGSDVTIVLKPAFVKEALGFDQDLVRIPSANAATLLNGALEKALRAATVRQTLLTRWDRNYSGHLMIIGGPYDNPVAQQFLKTLRLRVEFLREGNDLSTMEMRVAGATFRPIVMGGRVRKDYGVFLCCRNPFSPMHRVCLCLATHSFGIYAAAVAATSHVAHTIVRDSERRDCFAFVAECSVETLGSSDEHFFSSVLTHEDLRIFTEDDLRGHSVALF
jgi:hypothetical protein